MKKILQIPMYECKVYFYVFNTMDEIENLQKKLKDPFPVRAFGIVIPKFDIYHIAIVKQSNYINTFFHEIWHLTDYITSERGIKDEESKAYLQGFLGDKLLKEIL